MGEDESSAYQEGRRVDYVVVSQFNCRDAICNMHRVIKRATVSRRHADCDSFLTVATDSAEGNHALAATAFRRDELRSSVRADQRVAIDGNQSCRCIQRI